MSLSVGSEDKSVRQYHSGCDYFSVDSTTTVSFRWVWILIRVFQIIPVQDVCDRVGNESARCS